MPIARPKILITVKPNFLIRLLQEERMKFLSIGWDFCSYTFILVYRIKVIDMMPTAIAWAESFIFVLLAVLHLFWASGGRWGFEKSLPVNESGERIMNPKKRDSLIVGVGLLFFALFYWLKAKGIALDLPGWVMMVAGWLIPTVFFLRAIGDFKYVGFFKKLRGTDFGVRDTRIYSPLCLFLGIGGFYVAFYL